VGSALVRRLTALGYPVKVLTRNEADAQRKLRGEKSAGVTLVAPALWESAVKGCGAVVNLSGEPISTRWTPGIKREIMNSRVNTTARLAVRARRVSSTRFTSRSRNSYCPRHAGCDVEDDGDGEGVSV
jgi:NAD dependent epimerase/dehydratase family enzyme